MTPNRSFVFFFACAVIAVAAEPVDPDLEHERKVRELRDEAVAKFLPQLKTTDRIEVFLLSSKVTNNPTAGFPLRPYGDVTAPILEKKTLLADDSKKFLGLWIDAMKKEGDQAMCHYPIYGLRFYAGTNLTYETSICWTCNNYYVPVEYGGKNGYSWRGFPGKLAYAKGMTEDEATRAINSYLNLVIPMSKRPKERTDPKGP